MFYFEICLIAMAIVLLVAFVAIWDTIGSGLHVPYEPPIDWPVGHHLYKPDGGLERRSWRAKRIDDIA